MNARFWRVTWLFELQIRNPLHCLNHMKISQISAISVKALLLPLAFQITNFNFNF